MHYRGMKIQRFSVGNGVVYTIIICSYRNGSISWRINIFTFCLVLASWCMEGKSNFVLVSYLLIIFSGTELRVAQKVGKRLWTVKKYTIKGNVFTILLFLSKRIKRTMKNMKHGATWWLSQWHPCLSGCPHCGGPAYSKTSQWKWRAAYWVNPSHWADRESPVDSVREGQEGWGGWWWAGGRWPLWCRSHTISWRIFCRCVCGNSCEGSVCPLTGVMDRPGPGVNKKILCLLFMLTFRPQLKNTFYEKGGKKERKSVIPSFNVPSLESDVRDWEEQTTVSEH